LSEARVDRSALLFVAGLSTLATALLSLVPLGAALRAAPQAALQGAGRGGAGRRKQRRLRGAFIVAEVALAVTLTAATAVLLESLVRLERVDLGYRPDSVFVARVSLPPQRYSRPADVAAFYDRLHATLERQPGVVAAGVVSVAPLSGLLYTVPFSVAGRPPADRDRPSAHFRAISPGYLTAIRASLVAGRAFTEFDDAEAPRVALVSRALAERYFAGTDPIGQQLLVDDNDEGPRPLTVVGVVRNLRHVDLEGPPTYDIYIPLRQVHRDGVGFVAGNQFWTVRVTTDPLKYRPTFLTALREADPDAAASGQSSMAGYVDAALAPRRFAVTLLLGFAVMAVVLAAVGVYGVMAYSVAQRRREIGVRLALGARPGSVVGLVLWQALALSLVGVVLGAGASLLAGPMGGMFQTQATTFVETLKKSVREIRLTVSWPDGKDRGSISASQLVVILPETVGQTPNAPTQPIPRTQP
jgi:putative ABC transport system permease protein